MFNTTPKTNTVSSEYDPYGKYGLSYNDLLYNFGFTLKTNIPRVVPEVKDIIFNDPATIVFWDDNSKTVVKCDDEDDYDPMMGIALCFMKKALGNKGNYNDVFHKWMPKYFEQEEFTDEMILEKNANGIVKAGPHYCDECGTALNLKDKKCPKCGKIIER